MSLETTRLTMVINDDEIPKAAAAGIKSQFDHHGHKPSLRHVYGLAQIAKVIEFMAFGLHDSKLISKECPEFDRSLFVSFLPCGMGKTTALIETIKAIMKLPDYDDVSFVIFLSKLDEIEKNVKRFGLNQQDVGVITSKPEYNGLGNLNPKNARVLFTTQAMLEAKVNDSDGRTFAELSDFYYQGKPRQVRVWDEAILPSRTMVLVARRLAKTIEDLSRVNAKFADEVERFYKVLSGRTGGELIKVPEFAQFGVTKQRAIDALSHEEDEETIEALFALQGLNARVFVDNKLKEVSIAYDDILPIDIAPMLILDASGLQRKTYEYWQKHRKGIKFLPSPEKSYEGFTIHHWDRGAGNDAYAKDGTDYQDLASGVAKTIDKDVPADEKVLVVHRLENGYRVDMEKEISKRLTSDQKRVSFTTWGQHTATNDYADHKYVILVGTLNLNNASIEALGLSAKKQDIGTSLNEDEFLGMKKGELASDILQAACRGMVRKAIGDRCPPGCHLYIIHSNSTGIDGTELLLRVFPGSTYEDWEPIVRLSGKKQKALAEHLKTIRGPILLKSLQNKHGLQRDRLLKMLPAVSKYVLSSDGLIISLDKEETAVIVASEEGSIWPPH